MKTNKKLTQMQSSTDPPACLSPKSKRIWADILEQYELEPEALETLRVALENLDLGDSARQLLRTEGLVVDGKKHPAADMAKQHDSMFLRSVRALGLDVLAPGSGIPQGRRA